MPTSNDPAPDSVPSGDRLRVRLLDALAIVPEIRDILLEHEPVAVKRRRIRRALSRRQTETFDAEPDIAPLEWVLARDAVEVLRNIVTARSERLAGFSLLRYLDWLLLGQGNGSFPEPTAGFVAELEHLLRGIAGQTGIYPERVPAFAKHTGTKAATLRSEDLSRMARAAQRWLDRYPNGLDGDAQRRRERNRARILRHFGASSEDWSQWRWHLRHVIQEVEPLRKLVTLTDDEAAAVRLAREHGIPFGITPHYLSLFDREPGGGRDTAVRAQVIPTLRYVQKVLEQRERGESAMDFMLESSTSPIEGITRRYPMVVILKPFMTCPQICVYCQRNWQIEQVDSPRAALAADKLERALRWIEQTPEINEVLVTGGDPLLLSDARLESLLGRLASNPRIERIRIGTRMLVTLPQRVTESLANIVARYHEPGRREVLVVTHFESAYELSPESVEAIQRIRLRGIEIYNQLVFTLFNSRRFEAAHLRHRLRLAGVSPYYTFNTKGKEETDHFRVPIARLLQEQKEEARLCSGPVRTDETVFNVPGLGKNYVRAKQHHDLIAILPDGRRVYEFHPWEKKLALADTYVYTDVSIHDYLRRLRRLGDQPSDYRSIWYYY